jgi:hypothetical protein
MYQESSNWLPPGPNEVFLVDRVEVELRAAIDVAANTVLQALGDEDSERFGECLRNLVLGAAAQSGINAFREGAPVPLLGWQGIARSELQARADEHMRQKLQKTILFSDQKADIRAIERYVFGSCPESSPGYPEAIDLAAVAISRIIPEVS